MSSNAANKYAAGTPAYTTTTGFTQPAVNSNVQATFGVALWMVAGQVIYIATGGYYSVVSIDSGTLATIKNLGYTGNLAAGQTVPNSSGVTPGGLVGSAGAAGSSTSSGAYASRPSAASSGLLYFANDAPFVSRDTGAAWEHWVPGHAILTQPLTVASWTGLNVGTQTQADSVGGILLTQASAAGQSIQGLELTASAPWVATCYLTNLSKGGNYSVAGMFVRDSSGGRLSIIGATSASNIYNVNVDRYTNVTTYSAANGSYGGQALQTWWFRIEDDNTNHKFYWSPNGVHWVLITSESRTAWVPNGGNRYGICLNSFGAASSAWFGSWKVT